MGCLERFRCGGSSRLPKKGLLRRPVHGLLPGQRDSISLALCACRKNGHGPRRLHGVYLDWGVHVAVQPRSHCQCHGSCDNLDTCSKWGIPKRVVSTWCLFRPRRQGHQLKNGQTSTAPSQFKCLCKFLGLVGSSPIVFFLQQLNESPTAQTRKTSQPFVSSDRPSEAQRPAKRIHVRAPGWFKFNYPRGVDMSMAPRLLWNSMHTRTHTRPRSKPHWLHLHIHIYSYKFTYTCFSEKRPPKNERVSLGFPASTQAPRSETSACQWPWPRLVPGPRRAVCDRPGLHKGSATCVVSIDHTKLRRSFHGTATN